MIATTAPPRIAIIGGMGPLASTAFVDTIYERAARGPEQDAPPLLVWSDPSFPDRSTVLLDGRSELLATRLEQAVRQCCQLGAERVIVCCVTAHAVLPLLPPDLRKRIVSLVEILLSAVIEQRRTLLLLASVGTRGSGVLERHPLWAEASRWLCWPDDADQQRVHRAIYDVKRNTGVPAAAALIKGLLRKYPTDSFAAACTELHIVHKRWGRPSPPCVDPLDILASRIVASHELTVHAAGTP